MIHSFTQSGDASVLALGDSLTIEDAAELRSVIAEALAAATHLVLDLAGVPTADLCCLQLFCSAHRTAVRSGKTLELRNVGEAFANGTEEAGYARQESCLDGPYAGCLWIEQAGEASGGIQE
ncbi:MAG TPA: STAS domain-containing protein [Geobacteraceae bacterium]|nr:STAS domain-containing protein [Geobacteraceae bacterium]